MYLLQIQMNWTSNLPDVACFYMNKAILENRVSDFEKMFRYHIGNPIIITRALDILHVNSHRQMALQLYESSNTTFDEMQPAGVFYAAESNSDIVPSLYDDIRDDLILNPTYYVGYLTPEMKVYITNDDDWPYMSEDSILNALIDDVYSNEETRQIVDNPEYTFLQLFPSLDLAIQDNVPKGISRKIIDTIRQQKQRPLLPSDNPILIYYLRDLWGQELQWNPPAYTQE